MKPTDPFTPTLVRRHDTGDVVLVAWAFLRHIEGQTVEILVPGKEGRGTLVQAALDTPPAPV